MSRLDSDERAPTKASGVETTTGNGWYREYAGSPPSCLDFPDFLHSSACLQTPRLQIAPNRRRVTVAPTSAVITPKSDLEDTMYSRSLSIPEPIACSREGHEENDLVHTKTCFLEEFLLFEYNPILDTSTVYTEFPAKDQGTSTSVLTLPTTNADVRLWPFEMPTPTVVGATSSNSMVRDEHGMQGNQAVSNQGISILSATLRVAKLPARVIKSRTPGLVDSAALDRSVKDPAILVKSTLCLPPNAMVAIPTKQKRSPKQKPYRDTDIIMGRGGNATHHPGNQRYLVATRKCLAQYRNSERAEKTKVSQQLVDEVHAWGGRFLKRVKGSNDYVEVSNKIARTRASQALRDGRLA